MELLRISRQVMLSAAIAVVFASAARADVVAVSPAAFGAGSSLITFVGTVNGAEVSGSSFGGIQFVYSLGINHVFYDGIPAPTNNVTAPDIIAFGNPTGVLTLTLPGLQNLFGFGFALDQQVIGTLPNAATINLFNGATNVGALSYSAAADPTNAGGFAGIQSTLAFDRVQLTFNTGNPWAIDNIRFAATTVTPEPATFTLMLTGFAGLGLLRRRRR